MDKTKLSFGTIYAITDDIAELIIDDGVEVTKDMVEEARKFLLVKFGFGCKLLINKRNRYSYTFDAQLAMAKIEFISSIAILVYDLASELSVKTMALMPGLREKRFKVFHDRYLALNWLNTEELKQPRQLHSRVRDTRFFERRSFN